MHRAGALVLAVALVACGGDGDEAAAPTTTAAAAADDTAEAAAGLEPFLVTEVPAGFERQPDELAGTGPSSLDKAASDDGQEGAREFLQEQGFAGGYQRLWAKGAVVGEDGQPDLQRAELLIVFLYAFRDAGGAAAYLERAQAAFDRTGPNGERLAPFEVAGIPGASGYTGGSDEAGHVALVVFTKDRFIAQVGLAGPQPPDREVAMALARDQHGRL